jgi:hypothetical protein
MHLKRWITGIVALPIIYLLVVGWRHGLHAADRSGQL